MKKTFKIGLLVFLWIWIGIFYLAVGLRTGTANNELIPWFIGPIVAVPIWLVLRKRKWATWTYPILLTLFFFPTIPIYFTYLHYSSVLLRDILLTLFFAISIAALLHKGIINKLFSFALLLVIALFTNGFYGRFHDMHDPKIQEIQFDDYSLSLYKYNIRSECEYETQWRGKKCKLPCFLGHLKV